MIENGGTKRSAVLEFLSGLFAGIGIILLTLLIAILATALLETVLPYSRRNGTHAVAIVWALLAFSLGLLAFRYRRPQHRQASFSAGLVTAAALFLLLDSACWNFPFG